MQFGTWYPLAEAGDRTPATENVLQLRVPSGLLDYPRGKSAMVRYVHATDARTAAQALAGTHAGEALLCRHLIEIEPTTDLAAFCAKLRGEFVRRFGTAPAHEIAAP